MRILQVNVTCRQGSTGKIAYDLYEQLNKEGHASAICYGRGAMQNLPGIYKIATANETRLHALSTRITGWVGQGSRKATGQLIQQIEAFCPDVVHLHNIHGYYVNAYTLLLWLRSRGIPTLITMHDEWLMTGKCGHPLNCERWRQGCGNCPDKGGYPKSFLFDRTAEEWKRKKDAFSGWQGLMLAPVSHWLAGRVQQSPVLGHIPAQVVYNGIDTGVFSPAPYTSLQNQLGTAGKRVVLHVTPNFSDPHKGGIYVCSLAQAVREHGVQVLVVGGGHTPQHLPENVQILPRTENQFQLAQYYSLADLLVVTSDMESLPTVCLESLCCGTPVLGFDSGGTAEAAPAGYGRMVPYGDGEQLAKAALDLLDNAGGLYSREACATFGRNTYAKEHMLAAYLNLYQKLREGI